MYEELVFNTKSTDTEEYLNKTPNYIIEMRGKALKYMLVKGLRLNGSCVFCAPLDRCISRYIDRHSTDMSVDISTDTRPICRPICRPTLGRYIDQDMSVDISVEMSTDISVDMSVDILTESVCPIVGRHVDR